MKKYLFITIFGLLLFAGQSEAATFYINSECNTPGNGTTATCLNDGNDSYDNLDDFTETARTAGDLAIVRRVASGSQNGTDLNFTSDGTFTSPIRIEADYDNAWGDFASSSQTYTPVRGSKAMTASTTISDIAAGDWIYVYNDKSRRKEFAYEVASVVDNILTLYLPYKGDSLGAGQVLTIMPDAPVWGTVTYNFSFLFATDNGWSLSGLSIMGTNSSGQINIAQSAGFFFQDLILTGNGSGDAGILSNSSSGGPIYVSKFRILDNISAGIQIPNEGGLIAYISDGYFDGNNGSGAIGFKFSDGLVYIIDSEFVDYDTGTAATIKNNTSGNAWGSALIYARNLTFVNCVTLLDFNGPTIDPLAKIFVEDFGSTVGNNKMFGFAKDSKVIASSSLSERDTLTVRAGGGVSSIKIVPTNNLAVSNDKSAMIKMFEYPIYLNTSQTTITTYFKPGSTASWSADPTASQLFIELDVLASSSKAFRYTKRSTGTIDMNGSSDWQSLSITTIASQSGNAYLRGWYGKPQESVGTSTSDANTFFVDVEPTITQP